VLGTGQWFVVFAQSKGLQSQRLVSRHCRFCEDSTFTQRKPQNVLIDRHGVVRISDLGISKARDDDQEKTHTNTGTGTNTGTASITQSGTGSLTATAKVSCLFCCVSFRF
jgi:hypothetical protein